MIVKRICDAARLFDIPSGGYARKTVSWFIDFGSDGTCQGLVKCDTPDPIMVPHASRTSNVKAQPFVDKPSYSLGIAVGGTSNDVATEHHACYIESIRRCADATENPKVRAVLATLEGGIQDVELPGDLGVLDLVATRVDGELVSDDPDVKAYWADQCSNRSGKDAASCSICGRIGPIVNHMPMKIKRIDGPDGRGDCTLISANEPAFEQHGSKEARGFHVCEDCAWLHATVLNAMTEDDKHHLALPGIGTFIFWNDGEQEFDLSKLLASKDPMEVNGLLSAMHETRGRNMSDAGFHCLFASRRNGRMSIISYSDGTTSAIRDRIDAYFEAQDVCPVGERSGPMSIWQLMSGIIRMADKNPWKSVPKWLPVSLIRMALFGEPLPRSIISMVLERQEAEEIKLSRPRAALIKMCINQTLEGDERPLTTGLNREETDPGYLYGRMFATFVIMQRLAIPGSNSSITDSHYGAASTTPNLIMPNLFELAQHHMRKLKSPGFFARELQEIASKMPAKVPDVLDDRQRCRFMFGYLQQSAQIFGSKEAAADEAADEAAESDNIDQVADATDQEEM